MAGLKGGIGFCASGLYYKITVVIYDHDDSGLIIYKLSKGYF